MSEQGPSGYAVWTVLRRDPLTASGTVAGSETLADAVAGVEAAGVTVRGIYDVSRAAGRRRPHALAARRRRRGAAGGAPRAAPHRLLAPLLPDLERAWACTATPSSTRATCPAFLRGVAPESWLTVYPFVRSYEWYLLPDDERSAHARRARPQGRRVPRRHRQHRRRPSPSATTSGSSPLEADELDRPGRPDARPARDGCPPARARGGPVLHRAAHRRRRDRRGAA